MEKRTVTLRETAMKAVPSNREVTEAVLRLRDGPSERGTLITQERGGPFSAAVTLLLHPCYILVHICSLFGSNTWNK